MLELWIVPDPLPERIAHSRPIDLPRAIYQQGALRRKHRFANRCKACHRVFN